VSALDPVCLRLRKAYTQPTGAKGELSSAMSNLVTYPDFVNTAILRSKGRSRGFGSAMRRVLARRGLRILSAFRVPGEQKEKAYSLPGKLERDDQVGLTIVRLEEVERFLRRRRLRVLAGLEEEKLARRERRRKADCSMAWWRKASHLVSTCNHPRCVKRRGPMIRKRARPRREVLHPGISYEVPEAWRSFPQSVIDDMMAYSAKPWTEVIEADKVTLPVDVLEREMSLMNRSQWNKDSEFVTATLNSLYVHSRCSRSLGMCPCQIVEIGRWPGSTMRAKVGWKIGQRKYEELDNLRKDLDAGYFPEGEADPEYISRRKLR